MNKNQTKIIKDLQKVNKLLETIRISLAGENVEGIQFDYCNSPSLANHVDEAVRHMKVIESITYQK